MGSKNYLQLKIFQQTLKFKLGLYNKNLASNFNQGSEMSKVIIFSQHLFFANSLLWNPAY